MTLAEKIFARHMMNEKGEVGVPSVKPGDTGFARADLRFSHEYVTPMAAIFFERYVGKDAKVNDPSSILFFRDHLTFLDEVISEEKKKLGLLDLATQLKLKQQDFAEEAGHPPARRTERPQRIGGHLPLDRAGKLRAAGAVEYWLRLAHAACGRDWLRGFWHRHDRCFQFLDHERCAGEGAGVGEDRDSRARSIRM